MLVYYVMWHMKRKLQPLFDTDGLGIKRKYTFDSVMEILKCIRTETVDFCGAKSEVISTPTDEQSRILKLLEVSM
jgi:hypothetical protein